MHTLCARLYYHDLLVLKIMLTSFLLNVSNNLSGPAGQKKALRRSEILLNWILICNAVYSKTLLHTAFSEILLVSPMSFSCDALDTDLSKNANENVISTKTHSSKATSGF